MTPRHHVPEDLLLDYAAGRILEGSSLVIATHLTLCPACRAENDRLEATAGAVMSELSPEPLPAGSFEHLMQKLQSPSSPPERPPPQSINAWPRPVLRYLEGVEPRWRRTAPGIETHALPVSMPNAQVELVRFRSGFRFPLHTHGGLELTLVLSGGFTDDGKHFERGDLAVHDASHQHEFVVDADENCVALVMTEGTLVPLTWSGKLLRWLSGR